MIKPAIVVVGYNRPESLKRLLLSINAADYPFDDIHLIISLDRSDNTTVVERVANDVKWEHGEKIVRTFEERQGLRKHIIQCGDLSEEYGAVIILEDDLVVSQSFYYFAFNAINYYALDDRITGVALYSHNWNGYGNIAFIPEKNEYDVFLGQFSITWGQCWSKDHWHHFKEWYQKHEDKLPQTNSNIPARISKWSAQSWGKYFISYMVDKGKYYVIPYVSMTTNFAEVGQHNTFIDSSHQVPLLCGVKKEFAFCPFMKSVTYDVFFERIFPDDYNIGGVPISNICVDLNGLKPTSGQHEYVLTERSMDFQCVMTYGIRMHPIDSNITYEIPGEEIKLYKCGLNAKLDDNKKRISPIRINYELYGYYWKNLIGEGYRRLITSVARKIKK